MVACLTPPLARPARDKRVRSCRWRGEATCLGLPSQGGQERPESCVVLPGTRVRKIVLHREPPHVTTCQACSISFCSPSRLRATLRTSAIRDTAHPAVSARALQIRSTLSVWLTPRKKKKDLSGSSVVQLQANSNLLMMMRRHAARDHLACISRQSLHVTSNVTDKRTFWLAGCSLSAAPSAPPCIKPASCCIGLARGPRKVSACPYSSRSPAHVFSRVCR
ncbi:hypothetical protein IWX90DRAFT_81401 [Phyllosticta citrichinensis]|uniref:Uncharacterized protein n=1 Tax=Phyllosticta citrichinensis TaxID=1130410 RepID=A0ABR1XG16_9PEZI